jgi:hypothetical protein
MLERRSLPPAPLLLAADFLLDFLAALVWRTELVLEIPLPLHWWFPLPTHLRVESSQKRFLIKSFSPPFSIKSPVPSREESLWAQHSLLHTLLEFQGRLTAIPQILEQENNATAASGLGGGDRRQPCISQTFPPENTKTGSSPSLRPHAKILSPAPKEKALGDVSPQEPATCNKRLRFVQPQSPSSKNHRIHAPYLVIFLLV